MVATVPAKRGRKPAATTAAQPGGQVQSLTRGLKLLEWIAESHGSVALTELAQQAGETMDEIATEVMRMTRLMREIATASQEQSRGIEQVNIAVNQMDETAQQNAALVQQSSAATRSLEEQSHALLEAMAAFKVQTA